MDSQEAASIAVAVVFGVLTLVNLANFKFTIFRVYLLSTLSCVCEWARGGARRQPATQQFEASTTSQGR